jgi:hypothetical protein
MGMPALADLPDLHPRPRRELDSVLTIRLSSVDRERLERAARELGVSPGRLLRAIARQALGDEADNQAPKTPR